MPRKRAAWFLSLVPALVAAGQEPAEIPVAPSVTKGDASALASASRDLHVSAAGAAGVVDRKVLELVGAGVQSVPVFIVLRHQPQREVLDRYENPARLRLQVLEGRYAALSTQIMPSQAHVSQARAYMEKAALEVRRAAFKEIEAQIRPEQDELTQLVSQLGGRNVHRYTAINMVAAELPATAISALALHPSVAEISLVEQQSAQLAVSVPSLGAPTFWSAGYTGGGESVAVMDTGVRTGHPAFSGLNIVSKVFLDNGIQYDRCFDDDATSPEDKQGHGTHVAGIVASHGEAIFWPNNLGVARGLGTLYNLKIGHKGKFDQDSGQCQPNSGGSNTSDVQDTFEWAVKQAPWLKVFNYSYGQEVSTDDTSQARFFDFLADTYGLTILVAAGNSGPSPSTVSSPSIAYNVLSVANMDDMGTVDRSDDSIGFSSSRGPTQNQRCKPDIAAPGTRIESTAYDWDGGLLGVNRDFVDDTGTSMAAPQIAGSAALLRQAGVRDPLAIKALLLNTTDSHNWGSDRGWGYANLTRTFDQRERVFTSTLPAGRVRLYKGVANGLFYSTLTWNRTVNEAWPLGCLSNLDLFLYNASSGGLLSSSSSAIDNVEKAYTTASGTVVVNVTHHLQSSCRAQEGYGLAFSDAGVQTATGPTLSLSCTVPASVAASGSFSMPCTITNRGDLPALAVQGSLGFVGSTSSTSQDFGTIPAGGSSSRGWLVTAPASVGTSTLQFAAQSNSFGGLFSGSADVTFTTTSTACTVAVSPTLVRWPATGSSGTLNVSAATGCSWQAASNAGWITLTGGAAGSGNGSVSFNVATNTSSVARTGTITVAGVSATVEQAGAPILGLSSVGNMAHLASAGLWRTTISLVNTGTAPAQARLSFYGQNGQPLALPLTFPQTPSAGTLTVSTLDRTLSPGASLVIRTEGPDDQATQVGWAQLLSNGTISGFAIFGMKFGNFDQEAVVPIETRAAGAYMLWFDNTPGFVTSMAVANVSPRSADVAVTVRAEDGTVLGTHSVPLAAMGQTAFELYKRFPETAQRRGVVELRVPAGGQISVLGLRFNPGAFTTVPVLAK